MNILYSLGCLQSKQYPIKKLEIKQQKIGSNGQSRTNKGLKKKSDKDTFHVSAAEDMVSNEKSIVQLGVDIYRMILSCKMPKNIFDIYN